MLVRNRKICDDKGFTNINSPSSLKVAESWYIGEDIAHGAFGNERIAASSIDASGIQN